MLCPLKPGTIHHGADPISGFRDHSKWIPAALFSTLALILVAVFTTRPIYRHFKTRRAEKLASQASELIQSGELAKAQGPLAAAMALAPDNPEVIRQSARYATRFLIPQSLQYWEMLEATGKATESDLREHIGVALDLQRTDIAGKVLLKLKETAIGAPESWLLLMRHDAQRDDLTTSRVNMRAALNRFPAEPRIVLAAGAMMFRQPENPTEEAQGKSLLWSLAIGTNAVAVDAARALAANPRLDRGDKAVLASLLKKRLNPSISELLLIDDLLWDTQPGSRTNRIRARVDAAGSMTSIWERVQVAEWLTTHGADQDALSLLPMKAAQTNLAALERRLQALANLRRWDEIETELAATEKSNTDPMLRYTFQALTAAQTGRTNDAAAQFNNAIAAAGGDPRRLFFVALAAERSGRNDAAVRGWNALLDSPTFAVKAGQSMLRLLATMDDLPATARAFQKLLSFDPGNLDLQRDLAITQALLGSHLQDNLIGIKELAERNPENRGLRQALALIYLRLGNPQAAVEQLDRLPESPDDTILGRVIQVAVFGANQQRVRARTLAAPLANAFLRNSERELVADWLPRNP